MKVKIELEQNEIAKYADLLQQLFTPEQTPKDELDIASKELTEDVPAAMSEEPTKDESDTDSDIAREVTKEDIRAEAVKLTQAGKAKEVKEVFASFGVTKLSELDEKYYVKALDALISLVG